MTGFVTRFAPSPTGLLHLGHAFSALTAFDAAHAADGRFILRIEDIDHTRCKPQFEDAIFEDLAWLGIAWDSPVRRQSEHLDDYAAALERLRANGLVYRCFKTRKEIAEDIARAPHLGAEGPEGPVYLGAPLSANDEAALLQAGEPFAWRLSIARARAHLGDRFDELCFTEHTEKGVHTRKATADLFGDVILARKDAATSYHLASVCDDARQGITHVIRGEDLAAAAHLHTLLQALLDLPHPIYRHHRLILGPNGKRLAKRDKAATLRALRESGATLQHLRKQLGLCGAGSLGASA